MFLVAAFVAAFWAVAFVREAILSLFFALFAAFVLDPVIQLVQRKLKIGRGPAATLVVLGLVAATIVILALLLWMIPTYASRIVPPGLSFGLSPAVGDN